MPAAPAPDSVLSASSCGREATGSSLAPFSDRFVFFKAVSKGFRSRPAGGVTVRRRGRPAAVRLTHHSAWRPREAGVRRSTSRLCSLCPRLAAYPAEDPRNRQRGGKRERCEATVSRVHASPAVLNAHVAHTGTIFAGSQDSQVGVVERTPAGCGAGTRASFGLQPRRSCYVHLGPRSACRRIHHHTFHRDATVEIVGPRRGLRAHALLVPGPPGRRAMWVVSVPSGGNDCSTNEMRARRRFRHGAARGTRSRMKLSTKPAVRCTEENDLREQRPAECRAANARGSLPSTNQRLQTE